MNKSQYLETMDLLNKIKKVELKWAGLLKEKKDEEARIAFQESMDLTQKLRKQIDKLFQDNSQEDERPQGSYEYSMEMRSIMIPTDCDDLWDNLVQQFIGKVYERDMEWNGGRGFSPGYKEKCNPKWFEKIGN